MSRGWFARIGLRSPAQRAWAMYDWANSAFQSTVITAVFPIYFTAVAGAGLPPATATAYFAWSTTLALAIIAIAAPVLGALADHAGIKKKLLGVFLVIGVLATAAMFTIDRGEWRLAVVLFIIANIGVSGSFVFYDSLLPHIASNEEMDRVSSAGYALGYLGGGLLLAVNLLWIQKPAWFGLPDAAVASRLAFLSVAIWWAAFSIPLFRRVPEPPVAPVAAEAGRGALSASLTRLGRTFAELRRYRNAFLMLLAFLIYNDGINTIIRMAASYGTEIGIPQGALISAFVLVQFVGIPFAFLFGWLAGRIGAKRSIFLALGMYVGISVMGYYMRTAAHFYVLAIMVGTVQGGSQALSRSLFASMTPRQHSSEFFGFFAVFEKFAGIIGPAIFATTIAISGSSRNAILSVIGFFVVGAVLLAFVDVEAGRRTAREAELTNPER